MLRNLNWSYVNECKILDLVHELMLENYPGLQDKLYDAITQWAEWLWLAKTCYFLFKSISIRHHWTLRVFVKWICNCIIGVNMLFLLFGVDIKHKLTILMFKKICLSLVKSCHRWFQLVREDGSRNVGGVCCHCCHGKTLHPLGFETVAVCCDWFLL